MPSQSPSLIALMGLPSSGKSTIAGLLAKDLSTRFNCNAIVIGSDEVRRLIPSQVEKFNPDMEPFIKDLTLNNIRFCLEHKFIVINDDMNYYKSMRHELKQIAEEKNSHFILIHIQIQLETALEWNKKRGLPVPQDVIKRVSERFDKPGDYQWDAPVITIQADEISPESACATIISKLSPIITTPFKPNLPPSPTKPGIIEEIDNLTRQIIANFAKSNKYPSLMKKVSKFRISYIKTLHGTIISTNDLKENFKNKLDTFVKQLKQAK